MPRLKDAITGLVERLSGPYKGMPYLRYFKTEAEKKAYLDFYNKAKSGTADAPRSRRVSEGVYAEVQRSRGPDVGTTYNRFFKTEAERDIFLKRAQERSNSAKEVAEAAQGKPLTLDPREGPSVPYSKETVEEIFKKSNETAKAEVAAQRAARRSKANSKK